MVLNVKKECMVGRQAAMSAFAVLLSLLCLLAGSGAWCAADAQVSKQRVPRKQAATVTVPAAIVEQVINHPAVQQFLHPESPSRVPLVLSSHLLDPRLSLRKFGRPVKILPDAKLKAGNKSYLRFVRYSIEHSVATVEVRLSYEGMGGKFRFRRDGRDLSWRLLDARVWET